MVPGHRCISQILEFTVPEDLQSREMVVQYTSKSGEVRFHGGQHLKGSEVYPAGFFGWEKDVFFFLFMTKCTPEMYTDTFQIHVLLV